MRTDAEIVSLLDRLGNNVDTYGDAVVAQLIERGELGASHALFRKLPMNDSELPSDAPSVMKEYFENTRFLPPWVQPDLIERGEDIYTQYGPECLVVLLFKSLPQGYSMWHVAKTLHITGRMTAPGGNVGPLTRRILETLQFVVNVMGPGGFGEQGRARITTQKVRLIHATIRNKIVDSPKWGQNWERPLNQEEILMTMLTFSLIIIDGLKDLGIGLSKKDQESVLHLWKLVAHILSLSDELQPQSLEEARRMWAIIVARKRTESSSEGVDLTEALVDYGQSILPTALDFLPRVFLYHFNDKTVRKMLSIKTPNPLLLLGLLPIEGALLLLQRVERLSPLSRFCLRSLHLLLIKGLIQHWNHNQPVTFTLPERLQASWKLTEFCEACGVSHAPQQSHSDIAA